MGFPKANQLASFLPHHQLWSNIKDRMELRRQQGLVDSPDIGAVFPDGPIR